MVDAVESMAYAGQVPWHGLGTQVSDKLTPAEMLKAAKLDWTVSKQPISFKNKAGSPIEIPGQFAIIRDSDERVLSLAGDVYKPVQNAQVLEFFKKFCAAGHMTMETAGSLQDGGYIWALARIGKDFAVGGGKSKDEVRPYLLLMNPHVHGRSLIMQYTPIRVVCWNTLTMAIGASLKGNGTGFRMPHSQSFDVRKEDAERILGLMIKQTDEFKAAVGLLAKAKISKDQADKFFCDVLDFKPDAPKKEKESRRIPVLLPKFRAALEHAPGQTLATAAGTWWGALNAVTYVIDHETGNERTTALRNAWIGNHANTKRRALDIAIAGAK